MTKKFVTVVAVTSSLIMACQTITKTNNAESKNKLSVENQSETKIINISFTLAKNYFVKNTVEKLDNPKIQTSEQFNEIFGMATKMGKDGKPTEIDFKKQYVIAVIFPLTDLSTNINPISLFKNSKNEMTLNYKFVVGQKQSFTIRPYFAIIINKKENGKLTLKEIK